MFEGNEFSPLEIMDSKLSSTQNCLTWSIANVKNTDIPKTRQKILKRALLNAQEAINKALRVIDGNST